MQFYLVTVAAILVSLSIARADDSIWIEGEAPTNHTFNQHSWYSNVDVNKDWLSPGSPGSSDGSWLGHFENASNTVTASYSFTTTDGGDYVLWVRANVHQSTYAYAFDGAGFVNLDTSDPRERINLVTPVNDLRYMGWIKAGHVNLPSGVHTLTIQLSESSVANKTQGGIDAIALVNFQWAPSGTVQPPAGTTAQPSADDWFPFLPDDDAHAPESITDMSALVEKPAGGHGFLRRQNADLVFADGTPVKFWAVGARMGATAELRVQQAKLYAKHGIRMVRQHPLESVLGVLQPDGLGGRAFDADALDRWDHWFATLKAQGIYMTWSLFYPHIITADDGYPSALFNELDNKGDGKSSVGMVNFMPALQNAQWEWARRILEHTNPYTGLRYIDDPALAIIETHNEDSLLWHGPLNPLSAGTQYPLHTAEFKKLWRLWVSNRYSSNAALSAAWGAGTRADDSITNDDMHIYGAWEMLSDGPTNTAATARMGDYIRFIADTLRGFYDRREQRLRALGYQAVTITTAWKAGGPAANAANLWCDDAAEAIDRHNYFGGGEGGHNIRVGNIANETHMTQPFRGILSVGLFQVEDKPFVITEWTQKPPNSWKAEISPLMAFYGMGLQGWDAVYHFHASLPRMGGGWPALRSYISETPHYMGQFPALTYAIYNNHFAEGSIVAARRLDLNAAFNGTDALSQDFTGGGYDENEPSGNLATPLEVMAVGRVTAKIADGQAHSTASDWSTHWDAAAKTVTSNTGELFWDYGDEVVLAKSLKTQAVVGFGGGGTYVLPAATVSVSANTPFLSLLLTALDGNDLIDSGHILITAMARDRQTGSAFNADATQLLDVGGPPLLLEPVQATIEFKGAPLLSARVVDIYGVPTDRQIERTGNTVTIDGRYATYYYEILRDAVAVANDGGPQTGAGDSGPDGRTGGDGLTGDDGVANGLTNGCACGSRNAGTPNEGLAWLTMLAFMVCAGRRSRRR